MFKNKILAFLRKTEDQKFLLGFVVITSLLICFLPLFIDNKFKLNLYLVWSGAYRISIGQIPYMDFGMPMGIGFFIIPALFFKIISPQFYTLIIAQLFINILFLFTFYKLLSTFNLPKIAIALGLFSLTIIYIPLNSWPWYNNSVIFYELVSLCLLVIGLISIENKYKKLVYILLASLTVFLTFLTKQDGGGLTILISICVLLYYTIVFKNYFLFPFYIFTLLSLLALHFYLFRAYDVLYWFNYGQPPHFSRINLYDFINDLYLQSKWEKFYLSIAIIYLIWNQIKKPHTTLFSKEYFKHNLYILLTIAMLIEAIVFQVTSYNPLDGNIFYHAFGISLLVYISVNIGFQLNNGKFIVVSIMVLFIFSDYSGYRLLSIVKKLTPNLMTPPSKNVISKGNFYAIDTLAMEEPLYFKTTPLFKSLSKIKIPDEVESGLERIKNLDIVKNKPDIKILNMSELTFLEYELGVEPLHGSNYPLWFHVNICMFDREIKYFQQEVDKQSYDLILFETVPHLKNYFPYAVRDHIIKNYELIDRFCDIKGVPNVYVEVYLKKNSN